MNAHDEIGARANASGDASDEHPWVEGRLSAYHLAFSFRGTVLHERNPELSHITR